MTVKGIIYAIVNSYDGKLYVGKTRNTFFQRYGPRWWLSTTNILLQRTLKHAKIEDFIIYVLESEIQNENLNDREKYYAKILNSYCPYGYNVRECGEEGTYHGPEITTKIEQANIRHRKTYHVRRVGYSDIITITCVKEWCKTNGIREMAFRNLLCGLVLVSQGYTLPTTTDEQLHAMREKRGKTEWTVRHIATGEIFKVHNAAVFCENKKIGYGGFKTMLNGNIDTVHGYCLDTTILEDLRIYEITGPDGTIYQFNNINLFQREHKVYLRGLIYDGVKRHRKGWSNFRVAREGRVVHTSRSISRSILNSS